MLRCAPESISGRPLEAPIGTTNVARSSRITVGFAAIVSVTDAHCSISLISVGTFDSLWILRFDAKIMRT
jgi:hypothetical protein